MTAYLPYVSALASLVLAFYLGATAALLVPFHTAAFDALAILARLIRP